MSEPTADAAPAEAQPTGAPAQNTPPADTSTPAENRAPQPDGAGVEGGTSPATEPERKPAPLPETPDALDEDITKLAQNEADRKAEAEAKDKAAFADFLKAAGIDAEAPEVEVGKDEAGNAVSLPSREAGAILFAAQKSGLAPEAARNVLGMVTAIDRIRANERAEADRRTLRSIREETAREFGDNLGAAARDMVAGAQALFGADLWADIQTIPALTNDKRFVRAMAAYGRGLRNDNGGPAPAPAGGASGARLAFDLASFAQGTGR